LEKPNAVLQWKLPAMIAEVISIGDELTSGQRLDTNSRWISEQLGNLGIRTLYHTTVADELAANVAVFRNAIERADVVVASGGLGPTDDDLTREAVAAALGVDLVLDEPQLAAIEALFARRGRPMPPKNRVQAMLPRGSQAIPNPHGTAPGIACEIARPGRDACRLFCLPGVPAELFEMVAATVEPLLAAAQPGGQVIRHRRIKCYGAGESHLEAMLPDLIHRGRDPSVGITVHQATITLRITAAGANADECAAKIEPTARLIYETLGTLAFGEEDDELHHAVGRLIADRGFTLATAEVGSAGLIAKWLSDTAAAPAYYAGGIVALTAESAARALRGGDAPAFGAATKPGATSEAFAAELATACRTRMGTDLALATSAYPATGPASASVPTFGVALASAAGVVATAPAYAGHPDILQQRAAKEALNFLRHQLLGSQTEGNI
jgi:nicotinamide-nucleotide amidase